MLYFLIIGIIMEWFVGKLIEGGEFGRSSDLVVGVVGSFIGGYLFRFYCISAYGISGEIIMAAIGGFLLLMIIRLFKKLPINSNFSEKI